MKVQEKYTKISYLNCQEPSHQGQFLNYVCIQKNCDRCGLICTLCKQDHGSHRVVPLKLFVSNLKMKVNQSTDEDAYCSKLEELQGLKQEMLFELKISVQQIAQQFQLLEQDIIDSYTKIKLEIIQQIQLSMQLDDLMAFAINGPTNREEYILSLQRLSRSVNENYEEISFQLNFSQIMNSYQNKKDKLSKKLKKIESHIEQGLQQIQRIQKKQIKVASQPKLKYRFSSTFKASTITLNQLRTIAIQSSSAPSRFVLIEQGIGLKTKSIIFRAAVIKNWIGVGVCLKNRITQISYAFKYQTLGHGSYLLSNNGYTWSHSQSADNIHQCQFTFKQGSIVQVYLTPSQIEFKVRQTNTSIKIKVNFKEEEWPNVCFCANLCSQDDAIEILDE